MAIAVHHGLPIAHADIPEAFVQAELERLIYVKFPKGVYMDPTNEQVEIHLRVEGHLMDARVQGE